MTFKNVLIALDGSERAEQALPWVRALAPGAQVTLIQVIEPGPLFESGSQFVLADRYLESIADTFIPRARIVTRTGSATLTILDVADEIAADLIAITARRGEQAMGRVTEKVIHGSAVPLLVIPSDAGVPAGIHKILIPLDGSKLSELIVPWASAVLKDYAPEFILSHVVEEPTEEEWKALESQFPKEAPAFPGLEKAIERRRGEVEAYLAEKAERVRARFVVQEGRPSEAIVALARHERADLIAMAAHGHGFISRLVLGSVAGKLIRTSPVPILLVKHDVLKSFAKQQAVPTVSE